MAKNYITVTMDAIEELFDRKLEEKLEQKLEQKFDEKLKPIKDDISSLKTDVSTLKTDVSWLKIDTSVLRTEISGIKTDIGEIKDVTENRIYKELKETRREMKEGFAHLDDVTSAIVLDYNTTKIESSILKSVPV